MFIPDDCDVRRCGTCHRYRCPSWCAAERAPFVPCPDCGVAAEDGHNDGCPSDPHRFDTPTPIEAAAMEAAR